MLLSLKQVCLPKDIWQNLDSFFWQGLGLGVGELSLPEEDTKGLRSGKAQDRAQQCHDWEPLSYRKTRDFQRSPLLAKLLRPQTVETNSGEKVLGCASDSLMAQCVLHLPQGYEVPKMTASCGAQVQLAIFKSSKFLLTLLNY